MTVNLLWIDVYLDGNELREQQKKSVGFWKKNSYEILVNFYIQNVLYWVDCSTTQINFSKIDLIIFLQQSKLLKVEKKKSVCQKNLIPEFQNIATADKSIQQHFLDQKFKTMTNLTERGAVIWMVRCCFPLQLQKGGNFSKSLSTP